MRRVLLIDDSDEHAATLKAALRLRGFEVSIEDQSWRAINALRQRVPEWEFVLYVARNAPEKELNLLRDLIVASQQFQQSGLPEFLFASSVRCAPSLRIQIAKLGARYVRI
jgi:ActR/RegA family two-component response regulator